MRSIRHTGAVALVLAGLLLGAGCSSDSDDSNASADPASNTTPESPPGNNPSDDGENGDTSNGNDEPHDVEIPTIEDGNWTGGSIHVEVTGDREATFDAPASGSTLDGVTSAAFTDGTNLVSIGLGGSEESAISLTADGVSTIGGFRTNCTINFTENDPSNLAADFECNDLEAISTSATETYTIDVEGNFTLTR